MNKVQPKLSSSQRAFVDYAGEMAASLSFARSVGQIFALLYISPEPLSIDDLCALLRISKGNASVNLRVLAGWEAVEKTWVQGSRRAHYRALRDLRRIALKRLEEGLGRRLALAKSRMEKLEESLGEGDAQLKTRLREFNSFVKTVEKGVALLPKLESVSRLL